MNVEDIYFIIQGPIITFGQGPNNSDMGFNSYQTIVNNYNLLKNNGHKCLIVTWKSGDELQKNIIDKLINISGIEVLEINEPKRLDPDHRYKHHYSIKKAVEKILSENDPKYLCKIRTDQEINVNVLDSIYSVIGTNKLLVSELMKSMPFYIGDFIYAAKKDVFVRFINTQITNVYLYHSVISCDIGMRYFAQIQKKPLYKILFNYFLNKKYTINSWSEFYKKNIITIKSSDWDSLLWRNKSIKDILKNGGSKYFLFSENYSENYFEKSKSNFLIYIEGIKIYLFKIIKTIRK